MCAVSSYPKNTLSVPSGHKDASVAVPCYPQLIEIPSIVLRAYPTNTRKPDVATGEEEESIKTRF